MPRPRKHRRVCARPRCTGFRPCQGGGERVSMALDEYEAIRLIDLEGLTQEECAGQMEIARTTVQAIYAEARKKLAQCIVQGRPLHIGGGDVRFCEHNNASCGKGCCQGRHCQGDTQPDGAPGDGPGNPHGTKEEATP